MLGQNRVKSNVIKSQIVEMCILLHEGNRKAFKEKVPVSLQRRQGY